MRDRYIPDCEAQVHADKCRGKGTTWDHLTPISIASQLKWDTKTTNSAENRQWLDPSCHSLKDALTPMYGEQVRRLQKGGTVTLWENHNNLVMFQSHIRPAALLGRIRANGQVR